MAATTGAYAQSGVQTTFSIPAGPLGAALAAFGSQSGTQVSYEASIVSGKTSPGIAGTATREAAIARLLEGSGLLYSFPDPASVLVVAAPSGEVATDGTIVLETINVTASGGAGSGGGIDPYATAAPVSSIGAEELQQRYGGDPNAALRATPGTFTRQGANQPGYAVNIRGMAGNGRVNSMIDGVPQTFRNAAGHAADGGTLLYVHPEFLSGIDITRGVVAGGHGAGTLSGAANFRTLSADDILTPGQNIGTLTRLTAGSNGNNWSGLTAAAARNSLFADGSGEIGVVAAWADSQATNHRNGEGVFLDPPVSNSPTGRLLKFSIAPDDVHTLNLGYVNYSNIFRASGYDWALDNSTYNLNYRFNPDNGLLDTRVDIYSNATFMHYTGSDGSVSAYVNREIESYSRGGSVTNTSLIDLSGDASLKLFYGASYNNDDYRIVSGGASRGSNAPGIMEKSSVFADATLSWGMFDVVGGLRYDTYNLSGTRQARQGGTGAGWIEECVGPADCPAEDVVKSGASLDPRVSIVASPTDWLQFYATYAHTFRPPVSQEVFWGLLPNDPTSEGSGIHNNIGLRPETSRGWDIGLNVHKTDLLLPGDAAFLKLGYFNNRITDYITADVIPIDRCAGPAECYIGSATWINVPGTTVMSGIELEGGYDAGFAYANFSYTQSETRLPIGSLIGGDTSLGDITVLPKDYGMIDIGMRLFDEKFTLGAKARYVGESSYVSTSREGDDAWETVPAYTLFDIYGNYKLTEHSRLFFNIENVTDERYRAALSSDGTKYTGRGRTYWVGFSAKLGVPGDDSGGNSFPAPTDPVSGYDWTGAFMGLDVGYAAALGHAHGTLSGSVWQMPFTYDFELDRQVKGLSGGLYAGYNYHTPSPWVIGVDAGFSLVRTEDVIDNAKLDVRDPLVPGFTIRPTISSSLNWTGSARARLGVAFDRTMPYVAAGVAVANYDHQMSFAIQGASRPVAPPPTDLSDTYIGWTVGAGLEHAVTDNFTLKAEYRYSNLGSQSFDVSGASAQLDLSSSEMRFGLSYKF